MKVDVRLNAIVDPERANGRSLSELTRLVVAGGATLIQLRDKHGTTRRMIEEARAIKAALAGTGVPLVVNDRVDVALVAGADGVHLGQEDMREPVGQVIILVHMIGVGNFFCQPCSHAIIAAGIFRQHIGRANNNFCSYSF